MATKRVFGDYCGTTLAGSIGSGATSCTLVAMSSSGPPPYSFPAYVAGSVFTATLIDASTGTQREQVLVTNWDVGTNTINAMTRGVNGTTAKAYLAGDFFRLLVVADTDANTAYTDQENTFSQLQYSSSDNAVVAAGTNQGTATALTKQFNAVTSGTGGVRLFVPNATGSTSITVENDTSAAINLYPSTGAQIDALGANAPYVIPAGLAVQLDSEGVAQWSVVGGTSLIQTQTPQIFKISAVANTPANGLTISALPQAIEFRSATLGDGTVNVRSIPATISTVISSGSTGGTSNGVLGRIYVAAIDNAGTVELAWINAIGSTLLDEDELISTTAEGGAGAADTAGVWYSTTARASVPYRILGFFEFTEATAGTWVTQPSTIQGAGGTSCLITAQYGQTWQNLTASRAFGSTYTNTTGKEIKVSVTFSNIGTVAYPTGYGAIVVDGIIVGQVGYAVGGGLVAPIIASIPPNSSYLANMFGGASGTLGYWSEYR